MKAGRKSLVIAADVDETGAEVRPRMHNRFSSVPVPTPAISIPILIISMHADEEHADHASKGGAVFLLNGRREVETAPVKLLRGQIHLISAITEALAAALTKRAEPAEVNPPAALLTPRQRDVLRLIADGKSTKQVAAQLGLSTKTVEAHRGSIMDRLGIHNLAGLVRFALRAGLVSPDR